MLAPARIPRERKRTPSERTLRGPENGMGGHLHLQIRRNRARWHEAEVMNPEGPRLAAVTGERWAESVPPPDAGWGFGTLASCQAVPSGAR